MFERLEVATKELFCALDEIDDTQLCGSEAVALVGIISETERVLAARRVLATRIVDETNAWRQEGHRSVVDWMASATGARRGDAVAMLETARRLEELPLVAGEFRAGR